MKPPSECMGSCASLGMSRTASFTGWTWGTVADVLVEHDERCGSRHDIPVLSITKARGIVLASERFSNGLHSEDLTRYRVARFDDFVVDPMLLWDGQIARQTRVSAGVVSPDYRVYRSRDQAHPAFLDYLFRSPTMRGRYRAGARGTNVRRSRIGRGDFLALPVLLPPQQEQYKIAAILSAVDATIEGTRVLVEHNHDLRAAVLEDLLLAVHRGAVDQARLLDVATVQTGIAKGKVVDDEGALEVPYLRVANVQDGYLDLAVMKKLKVEPAALERYRLHPGDVLFTEGGDADKLGRGCVWNGEIDPCLHQNHVFAVRPDRSRLLPEFLAALASSRRGRSYFAECAKQTTNLASINSTQLKSFPVLLPRLAQQERIVSVLVTMADRQRGENENLAALLALKEALSSALLAGEAHGTPSDKQAA